MAETLPLDQLEGRCDNLYEAIVIIARRARQINELQKQLLDKQVEQNEVDEFDENGFDIDLLDSHYLKLPKPTSLALQEMLEGKLDFESFEKEE